MTVETLLKKFQEHGGEIKETGKTVQFYAPDDIDITLKEEVVDRLKEIKTFYLSTEAKDKEIKYWEGLPLSKLADQKIAIKIKSSLVGEDIWLVSTAEEMDKVKGPQVVYTAQEAIVISGLPKEFARKVHAFKKKFKGEIF